MKAVRVLEYGGQLVGGPSAKNLADAKIPASSFACFQRVAMAARLRM